MIPRHDVCHGILTVSGPTDQAMNASGVADVVAEVNQSRHRVIAVVLGLSQSPISESPGPTPQRHPTVDVGRPGGQEYNGAVGGCRRKNLLGNAQRVLSEPSRDRCRHTSSENLLGARIHAMADTPPSRLALRGSPWARVVLYLCG
jgi:hypothetical protein